MDDEYTGNCPPKIWKQSVLRMMKMEGKLRLRVALIVSVY
jgi:hypothetical protein